VKAKRAPGDQANGGVGGFDAGVGESVLDRGFDPWALLFDRARELDERLQAAATRPLKPGVQQRAGVLCRDAVDLAQLLLERVGAVEPLVGLLDARELGFLAAGEVLGVLPEREARALELARDGRLAGPAGLVSDLAADLVERVGRERHDVEGVHAADRVRAALGERGGDPGRHVGRASSICSQRSGPSASRNASTVRRSRPAAAHTSRPVWWQTTTVK